MIPIIIVTGYLGSGKTTLISRLLTGPEFSDTAVIVNEFGETDLDHTLISASHDNILQLMNGCVCCTIREDLALELRNLHYLRTLGDITRFNRVVIETTGLADPVPIIHTLMANTSLRTAYCMQAVVTLVDAVAGDRTLDQQSVSARQVAYADYLLITKTDIAAPNTVAELSARLRVINPGAGQYFTADEDFVPRLLLADNHYPVDANDDRIEQWLAAHHINRHSHRHHDGILTFTLIRDEPISLAQLVLFFQNLVNYRPEQLLRVKGLVAVVGKDNTPAVVHCIREKVYPINWLKQWPSADRSTRLVFITDGLAQGEIEKMYNDLCED